MKSDVLQQHCLFLVSFVFLNYKVFFLLYTMPKKKIQIRSLLRYVTYVTINGILVSNGMTFYLIEQVNVVKSSSKKKNHSYQCTPHQCTHDVATVTSGEGGGQELHVP